MVGHRSAGLGLGTIFSGGQHGLIWGGRLNKGPHICQDILPNEETWICKMLAPRIDNLNQADHLQFDP